MTKMIKKLTIVFSIILATFLLTSCTGVDVTGNWYSNDGDGSVYVFNSDGTYENEDSSGTYEVDDTLLVLSSDYGDTYTYEILKDGDDLVFSAVDEGVWEELFSTQTAADESAAEIEETILMESYQNVVSSIVGSWEKSDGTVKFNKDNTFTETIVTSGWFSEDEVTTFKGSYAVYFDEEEGPMILVKYIGDEGDLGESGPCTYYSEDGEVSLDINGVTLTATEAGDGGDEL